jgi:hypothetical protein
LRQVGIPISTPDLPLRDRATPTRRQRSGLGKDIMAVTARNAALALARKRFRVRVLEQAREFGEIGVGLQVAPNALWCSTRWASARRSSGRRC